MSEFPLSLTARELTSLFPFHIALDKNLGVEQLGSTLRRRYPDLSGGTQFDELFRIVSPHDAEMTPSGIATIVGQLCVIETLNNPLRLKGLFRKIEAGRLLFMGSPLVSEMSQLESLGLTLHDFPPHELASDFLVSDAFLRTALTESRSTISMLLARNHEMREDAERYKRMLDSLSVVAFVASPSGCLSHLTGAWEAITGFSNTSSLNANLLDYLYREDRETVIHLLSKASVSLPESAEIRLLNKDGGTIWVELRVQKGETGDTVYGSITDVRLRHGLEARIRQDQNVESIGRLAGIVTHNLNEALGVISGSAEMLAELLEQGDKKSSLVADILRAASLMHKIPEHLEAFASKLPVNPGYIELSNLVERITTSNSETFDAHVRFLLSGETSPGVIFADEKQITQAVYNLIQNGLETTHHAGLVTIEVDAVPDSAYEVTSGWGAGNTDRHPVISVTDNGPGLTDAELQRVFEPNYSEGASITSGLRLATAYAIVRQHSGFISVASTLGAGTTFTIHLPLASPPEHCATGSGRREEIETGARIGSTVLVADDEPAMVAIIGSVIARHGFKSIAARDGIEALALFREHGSEIGLIITDIVMPGMNGIEFVEKVQAEYPDMPVLLVSGYSDQFVKAESHNLRNWSLLQKPFKSAQLGAQIIAAMSGK